MRLTKYDLAAKPVSTRRPSETGSRYRAMYSIIHDEIYRADLRGEGNARAVATKWGVSVNTVRQHRCNLRKRGEL